MSSHPEPQPTWPDKPHPARRAAPTYVLAADIGGTHARLGLIGRAPDMPLLAYQEYACHHYPSLQHLVRKFLAHHANTPITHAVLACPGRVLHGTLHNRNLPWPVVVAELRRDLGIPDLAVTNDFAALAYGVLHTKAPPLAQLSHVGSMTQTGPQIVIGPGTGLGAAVLLPDQPQPRVLSTEAGQAGLSPSSALEMALMRVLCAHGTRQVSWEDVLSGPGLLRLYVALCTLENVPPTLTSPEAVSAAAHAQTHPQASRAVEVFCAMLGSFAGDMALFYGASGGIWLAGGMLPALRDDLTGSAFLARFINKGCMRDFLKQVPIHLLQHGQLGVTGAASWYFGQWDRIGNAPDDEHRGETVS